MEREQASAKGESNDGGVGKGDCSKARVSGTDWMMIVASPKASRVSKVLNVVCLFIVLSSQCVRLVLRNEMGGFCNLFRVGDQREVYLLSPLASFGDGDKMVW